MSAAPTTPTKPPSPDPGTRLATYFENFFRTLAGISTLGASITFSKIVSSPVVPFHDFGFSPNQIQYLIAISWLFFFCVLAFTSLFASLLTLYKPQAVEFLGARESGERRKVMWYATFVSSFLYGLIVLAFLFLSLVVVGYAGAVGWVACAIVSAFGIFGLGYIFSRSPLFVRVDGGGRGAGAGGRGYGRDPVIAHMKLHGMWDEKAGAERESWAESGGRRTSGLRGQGQRTDSRGGYQSRSMSIPRRFDDKRFVADVWEDDKGIESGSGFGGVRRPGF